MWETYGGSKSEPITPSGVVKLLSRLVCQSDPKQPLFGDVRLPGTLDRLKGTPFWAGQPSQSPETAKLYELHADEEEPDGEAAWLSPKKVGDLPSHDVIMLNPPFGYLNAPRYGNRLENLFLSRALSKLSPGGRCAAVVPNGLLGRDSLGDRELRRALCEEYHLSMVLLLPLSLFSAAQVYTSVLYLENRCSPEDRTELYDLRSCPLNEDLHRHCQTAGPTVVLTRELLAQRQYVLLPEPYLSRQAADLSGLIRQRADLLARIASARQSAGMGRKADKRRLIKLLYHFLACELSLFRAQADITVYPGEQLFHLKNGEKRGKGPFEGPYPLYGAGGVYGTAPVRSMKEDRAVLVGRVGSFCGNAFQVLTPGFVSDNAIIVTPNTDLILPELLPPLLLAANLVRHARGTGQPYITQGDVYHDSYAVPSLEDQRAFLRVHKAVLEEIEELELELEAI